MELKRLLSLTRKAVDHFQLIDDGDKIAIGISGGKDSLTLLYALHGLRQFYPSKFDLIAITVDLCFEGFDTEPIRRLCNQLDVPYYVIKTEISQIVFRARQEGNPCSLCAKMRKGALNDAIKAYGCNKVAYAHHKDDVIETMMMSMIYEGRYQTIMPDLYLNRSDLHVIRPLIYVNEADIIGFVHKMDLPVQKSKCPADGYTKREYVKNLIRQLNRENPGVKDRMFTAIENSIYSNYNL